MKRMKLMALATENFSEPEQQQIVDLSETGQDALIDLAQSGPVSVADPETDFALEELVENGSAAKVFMDGEMHYAMTEQGGKEFCQITDSPDFPTGLEKAQNEIIETGIDKAVLATEDFTGWFASGIDLKTIEKYRKYVLEAEKFVAKFTPTNQMVNLFVHDQNVLGFLIRDDKIIENVPATFRQEAQNLKKVAAVIKSAAGVLNSAASIRDGAQAAQLAREGKLKDAFAGLAQLNFLGNRKLMAKKGKVQEQAQDGKSETGVPINAQGLPNNFWMELLFGPAAMEIMKAVRHGQSKAEFVKKTTVSNEDLIRSCQDLLAGYQAVIEATTVFATAYAKANTVFGKLKFEKADRVEAQDFMKMAKSICMVGLKFAQMGTTFIRGIKGPLASKGGRDRDAQPAPAEQVKQEQGVE